MQPKREKKILGLVDKAKISSGFNIHIPNAVARYFSLEVGDVLEFYNPFTDIPNNLFPKFEVIAVVVKRKHPITDEEYREVVRRARADAKRKGRPLPPIGPPFMEGKHLTPEKVKKR